MTRRVWGENLHDHPGVGLHHEGAGSGYGLDPAQWPRWGLAPFAYHLFRRGPLASPTCEAGAFFNARGDGGAPDVQSHFIPFFSPMRGRATRRRQAISPMCASAARNHGAACA
jgi:choline dehydrogenase